MEHNQMKTFLDCLNLQNSTVTKLTKYQSALSELKSALHHLCCKQNNSSMTYYAQL